MNFTKRIFFTIGLLLAVGSLGAQTKIWLDYPLQFAGRAMYIRTAKQSVEISTQLTGDITSLVSDDAKALEYAKSAASHHKTGTIVFWTGNIIGLGAIGAGTGLIVTKKNVQEFSELVPGLALVAGGMLTTLICNLVADYQFHKGRHYLLNAVNAYNGVVIPAVSVNFSADNFRSLGGELAPQTYSLSWHTRF